MRALITGITGQDGAYLAKLLLSKGYEVHGIKRPSATFNTARLEQVDVLDDVQLHYGDLTDGASLQRVLNRVRPNEVYNLGAQSHVKVSFDLPEYTADVAGLGTMRLLEAMRSVGLEGTRFYQASSSEMFGRVLETPQNESTPFYPRSPYGIGKVAGYWTTVNYREAYGMHASNGILFNHESPIRGETFVTRKITRGLVRIKQGWQDKLLLGNLEARRDWGHAADYVDAMWRMVNHPVPDDYVVATGEQYSVRQFVETAAACLCADLEWVGTGVDEVGYLDGVPRIVIDPAQFRPTEVDTLLGDSSKARAVLGWRPRYTFAQMVNEMITEEEWSK